MVIGQTESANVIASSRPSAPFVQNHSDSSDGTQGTRGLEAQLSEKFREIESLKALINGLEDKLAKISRPVPQKEVSSF